MTNNVHESRLKDYLDPLALFLLVAYTVYRTYVSSLNDEHSSNFFAASLILIGATVWLLARILEGGFTFRAHGMDAAVFGLLAAGALSIGSSKHVLLSAEFSLSLGATLLMLYVGSHAYGRARAGLVMSLFLALTSVIVLYGLAQKFFLLRELLTDPAASHLMATPDGRERIERMQPMSVFLNPNQFGMFCAFAVLVLIGSMSDARAVRNRHVPFKAALAVLTLMALFFTSSKGAWIALLVGAAFFVFRILKGRWAWIWFGGCLAAGIIGSVVVWNTASMQIRAGYWDAAWDVAWIRPLTGIGLNTYQEYHSQYKEMFAPDVKLVHNDYLQVLCEMGVLGLVSLLGLGAALVRRLGYGPSEPGSPGTDSPWLVGSAVALGTALAWGLDRQFSYATLGLIALLVGTLIFVWRRSLEEEVIADPKGLRRGIAAGVVAWLAHMVVDFDWYEHAFLAPIFLMAGLGIGLGGKGREVVVDRMLALIVAAFLLLVTLIGGIYPSYKLRITDSAKEEAKQALVKFQQSRNIQDLAHAAKVLEESGGVHQWDPDLHERLADVYHRLAQEVRPRDAKEAAAGIQSPPDTQDKELRAARERVEKYSTWMNASVGHIKIAITLRERHEGYRIRCAELLMELGDYLMELAPLRPDPTLRSHQQILSMFQESLAQLEHAETLSPDLPKIQFLIGDATRKMGGREKEVVSRFKKAKEWNEKTNLYYRKLNQDQLNRIEEFLKRAE